MENKHIIFLDTSIFESENFFKGRNLLHVCDLSKKGLIEIKITDITYNEIINRIKENIHKSQISFKKVSSLINNEAKILKNIEEYKVFFNLPKFEIEDLINDFKVQLDKFITDNSIEIIDSKISNLKEVFENYFKVLPPFKEGKKKSEFPDAFTYSTIKEWSILNNKNTYFISNDGDFDYLSIDSINCSHNLSTIIDLITREINAKHTIYIDSVFEKYIQNVITSLEEDFDKELIEAVYDKITNDPFYEEPEIDLPYDIEVEIKYSSINDLNLNTSFSYEIECEIIFSIQVEYIDYSSAFYDKEDSKWYNEERIYENRKYSSTIVCIVDFWYNLEEQYDELYTISDFNIKEIEEI